MRRKNLYSKHKRLYTLFTTDKKYKNSIRPSIKDCWIQSALTYCWWEHIKQSLISSKVDLTNYIHLKPCVPLMFIIYNKRAIFDDNLLDDKPETLSRNERGRVGSLKSDSTHHFFRNACTKSGSLRFSQFSGCCLILSVYILMSFDFPFVRLVAFYE
jgi:hypothetical protein